LGDIAVVAEQERGCLNCGAALALADARPAHYCPDCGQETDPRPPTVVELVRQLLSHYASAEGRLWPTLVGLISKPGFLTAEYLAGRRRRYIVPTRLYLTMSILFFVVVKVLGAGNLANPETQIERTSAAAAKTAVQPRTGQEIPRPTDLARDALEEARKDFKKEFAKAQTRNKAGGAPFQIHTGPDVKGAAMDDSILKAFECETDSLQCRKIKDWLADRYGNITVREFITRLKDRMIALAPYAMFMLLPVFATLTWLLYWRRRLYYSEHLVYALHVHSFAFLLLLTISVMPKVISDLLWFAGAAYFWFAMRRVFGGRWWMTTLRWAVLGMVYPILLSFSIVFTLAIAILLV
jgi:predicted RNA-binding Zn-ribbon protein involved in translation (DUF1610 family)